MRVTMAATHFLAAAEQTASRTERLHAIVDQSSSCLRRPGGIHPDRCYTPVAAPGRGGPGPSDQSASASGACSAQATWKLKAKDDDGRIQAEFEVDGIASNRTWHVTLADNGTVFFSGNRHRTDGDSFTVRAGTPNQAGTRPDRGHGHQHRHRSELPGIGFRIGPDTGWSDHQDHSRPTSLPFGPDVSQRHWWRPARPRFATGLDPFDAAGPDLRLAFLRSLRLAPPVGPPERAIRAGPTAEQPGPDGSAAAGRIEGWGGQLFSVPAASRTVREPAPVGH